MYQNLGGFTPPGFYLCLQKTWTWQLLGLLLIRVNTRIYVDTCKHNVCSVEVKRGDANGYQKIQ